MTFQLDKNIFKMKNLIQLLVIVLLTGLYACSSSPAGENHDEHGEEQEGHDDHGSGEEEEGHGDHGDGEEEEGHDESGVSINDMQAEMIGLKLSKIQNKNLRNTIKVNGTLELFPQDRAEVSPLIGCNVKSIFVVEGDDVKKGQLLALMEHPDYIQMQQDYQQKLSMVEFLKLEYQRKEKLYKDKVSSGREYQEAKSNYNATQSAIKGMEARLKMMGLNVKKVAAGKIFSTIPIVSPIKGSVHMININVGEFAGPQMGRKQIMFEVTDNSRLHVDLRVFEKDIYKVRIGQKTYFTVSSLPDQVLEATIDAVGKAFEDSPKSVHVHASIKNPGGLLIPGAYVNGRIALDEQSVAVIAESAILSENGTDYVFVKVAGDGDEGEFTFEKMEVITGIKDVGLIEIKNANKIPANAEIVINGAYTLSSEMIKGELEHEH